MPAATVAAVTRGNITHTLNLAGQFQPYQVIDVHAKVSGYIRHIYVDIGDKVHQGQVLAMLEVPELSAQLKGTVSALARSQDEITRAQHDVARAQSEHSALHADYTRLQQAAAAQPGLIAQQELDDAQSRDLASEAQVDAAKAALAAAKQQSGVAGADNERVAALEDYTRVTAPLDGVIIWRYADTGALIQAGTSSLFPSSSSRRAICCVCVCLFPKMLLSTFTKAPRCRYASMPSTGPSSVKWSASRGT